MTRSVFLASALVLGLAVPSAGGENGKFPRTFAELAVPEAELPRLVEGHPRLLLRAKPWKGGLSVAGLKERLRKEPWAGMVKGLKKPDAGEVAKYPAGAARYYLFTGDESVVPDIVAAVLASKPRHNCGGGMFQYGIAYDWICGSPTVTAEQRRKMADRLAEIGRQCAKIQEGKIDMYHHYGSGGWGSDVLLAGLVLGDEHPEGRKLLAQGVGFFKAAYLPGWKHTGGGWQGGGGCYSRGMQSLPTALACWESATEEGILQTVKEEYGDWLQGYLYFQMSRVLPGQSYVRTGGFEHSAYDSKGKPWEALMAISSGYRNPDGYAFLRWMGYEPKSDPVLYDEETDRKKPRFPNDLPKARIWGRGGLGYAQFRSDGWSADSAIVEFKCGDMIWSHTHNWEQNGFRIFHKGHLAIKGGGYYDDTYFGNHSSHYYARTISSNSMLVYQPGEVTWTRKRSAVKLTDKDGFYPEPGGQRLIHGSCNTFTFAEYLKAKEELGGSAKNPEMGDITAFEAAPDGSYAYVCGDATMAYNNPKVCYAYRGRTNKPKTDLFTRSMVWLDGKYLAVFDRVNTLDDSYRKVWLLHSISRPEVSGKVTEARVPGHIEDFDGDTVKITWAGGEIPLPEGVEHPGRLFSRTFLPAERTVRRIGGDGYEFWSNGANQTPGAKAWPRPEPKKGDKHFWADMGAWRVEVSPAQPAGFDNFLHLLYICDARTEEMPPAEMVSAEGGDMVGVAAGGWLVLFGRKGQLDGEVAYTAPAGVGRHLIVDLRRGAEYSVEVGGRKLKLTASKEGTLSFEGGGKVTVRP